MQLCVFLRPQNIFFYNSVDGGQFWVNGTRTLHLPRTAYSMNGAGGQYTIIDPVNDLVVVRLGHRRGGAVNDLPLSSRPRLGAGVFVVSEQLAAKAAWF